MGIRQNTAHQRAPSKTRCTARGRRTPCGSFSQQAGNHPPPQTATLLGPLSCSQAGTAQHPTPPPQIAAAGGTIAFLCGFSNYRCFSGEEVIVTASPFWFVGSVWSLWQTLPDESVLSGVVPLLPFAHEGGVPASSVHLHSVPCWFIPVHAGGFAQPIMAIVFQ